MSCFFVLVCFTKDEYIYDNGTPDDPSDDCRFRKGFHTGNEVENIIESDVTLLW